MRRLLCLALLGSMIACDGSGDPAALEVGECSDAPAAGRSWEFADGLDGWTAGWTTPPRDTVFHEEGEVWLRGYAGQLGQRNAWLSTAITLPNSCQLTLAITRQGHGLGSGYLRVRLEGSAAVTLLDWTSVSGTSSRSRRTVDISASAGRGGTLVIEWDDQPDDAGGEEDYGIVRIDEVEIY